MTSYQARKKEISNLEKKLFLLEHKLRVNGIEFGQLIIDIKKPPPTPPAPPLTVIRKTHVFVFCDICHSTMSKRGYLGMFGERRCDNKECINSK